jgi:hypothetical protein
MGSKKKRQTVTVDVVTVGNQAPADVVAQVLRADDRVRTVDLEDYGQVQDVPGPNRQRLIRLAQWAAGEDAKRRLGLPNEWEQGAWLTRRDGAAEVGGCGTACCIAGKVAIEDGGVPVVDELGDWARFSPGYDTSRVVFPEIDPDEEVRVEDYAQEKLGLTYNQRAALFSGSNTLDDVLRIIGDLLEEAGPEPVTVRRLREGYRRGCETGESCDICYEDVEVPADQAGQQLVYA